MVSNILSAGSKTVSTRSGSIRVQSGFLPRKSRPRGKNGSRVFAALALGALLLLWTAPALWAQGTGPEDIADELARAKARIYKLMIEAEQEATPNQGSYDVTYYGLDLEFDTTLDIVSGTVEVRAKVTAAEIDSLELNLKDNMNVSAATAGGGATAFSHAADILTIYLDRTYLQDEMVTVSVTYAGDPSGDAFAFDSRSGQPMIWSLSEPFGARTWWPCKDLPGDKADSVDVKFTVPEGMIAASNGLLVSSWTAGGKTTYWWHESYPITTYLVSIAAYAYTTFSDYYVYSPTDSMEIQFYVYPDHYSYVQDNYAKTKTMIAAYASMFGEYPFLNEKYGHAEFQWGGGMEHQTITSLGGWGESLIAHELGHMWWGDMITCADFHHVWLNEGFATYCEALWNDWAYGRAAYKQDMEYAKYFGPGTVYCPDVSDFNRIFNGGLSYNKGSWVLHMLRHVVGDETFFDILHAYYADPDYQYGTATTEDFQSVCESVSGMDLSDFFHQWIYEEYYPDYYYTWNWSENGGLYDIELTIEQLQTNTVFKMPIDITITSVADVETTIVVGDSLGVQSFTLTVDGQPKDLELDKDDWILKQVEAPMAGATLDRGILLVNGVAWTTYGSEIASAYEDSAFWGRFPVSFWDCFDEPSGGYPSNLPAPLGHGPVPADTLKQFSSLIWVGNNYGGDLADWQDTDIMSYLRAGGNVLLMSRMGTDFLSEPQRDYLGISWVEDYYNTINNCVSAYPGMSDMARLSTQSYVSVFDTTLATPQSVLLLKETSTFTSHRGLGVLRDPPWGGSVNPYGAQFAFLSGRPYRWNHGQLRSNVEFILENFFKEDVLVGSPGRGAQASGVLQLYQNFPNPFSRSTAISFYMPKSARVRLAVYDASGRQVALLLEEKRGPGLQTFQWNGTDRRGRPLPSGVYFYRLETPAVDGVRKMTLIR
jgi:aminopeptidase N